MLIRSIVIENSSKIFSIENDLTAVFRALCPSLYFIFDVHQSMCICSSVGLVVRVSDVVLLEAKSLSSCEFNDSDLCFCYFLSFLL